MPSYGVESNLFAYLKAKSQGPGGMLFNRGILSLSSAALLLLLGVMLTGIDAEPFETIGIVCISFAVLMVILALRFFSASSERSREWTDRFVRAYFHPGHESLPHRVLSNLGDRDTPSPQEQPIRSLPVGMKPPPYDSVIAFGIFPPAECAYMFLQPPPTYDGLQSSVGCSGTSTHPLSFLYTPEEPPAYQSAEILNRTNYNSLNHLSQRSQNFQGHSSPLQSSSSFRLFQLREQPVQRNSAINTIPIALLCHGQLVTPHHISNHNNDNKMRGVNRTVPWTVNYPQLQHSLDRLNQSSSGLPKSLPHSATLPAMPSTSEDFMLPQESFRSEENVQNIGVLSARSSSEDNLPQSMLSIAEAHSEWVLLGGLVEELHKESYNQPSFQCCEVGCDSNMSLSSGNPHAVSPTADSNYVPLPDNKACDVGFAGYSYCQHDESLPVNGNIIENAKENQNGCHQTLYFGDASCQETEINVSEIMNHTDILDNKTPTTLEKMRNLGVGHHNESAEKISSVSETDIKCGCNYTEPDINCSCANSESDLKGS